jgi:hypothetical protein
VTLIFVCIGVPLEIAEFQASAVRSLEFVLLLAVLEAEGLADQLESRDDLFQLGQLAPDEDADRVLPVGLSVLEPVAAGALGLAAAPSTAEEDLEDRAADQRRLRAFLRLPDDLLFDHMRPGVGAEFMR